MAGPVIQARVALGAGELALLMGPSGSGKTTLLSILGCMLKPSAGAVTVGGQATDGLGPEELARLRRAHIGFVFQSYHLFPTLTAVENVRLALDVRGLAGRAARPSSRPPRAVRSPAARETQTRVSNAVIHHGNPAHSQTVKRLARRTLRAYDRGDYGDPTPLHFQEVRHPRGCARAPLARRACGFAASVRIGFIF
jgi:ABC-type sugar transport system ATPase subunit